MKACDVCSSFLNISMVVHDEIYCPVCDLLSARDELKDERDDLIEALAVADGEASTRADEVRTLHDRIEELETP